MIDEEWLNSLQFETLGGCKVTGLIGIGADKIVFRVVAPDGEELVLKTYKKQLGFLIREIPMALSSQIAYNVDTLNQKLYLLIGNSAVDEMCRQYNRLYSYFISKLYEFRKDPEWGVPSLIFYIPEPDDSYFILNSPGIKLPLNDLASLSFESELEIIEFNRPSFLLFGFKHKVSNWAEITLKSIDNLIPMYPNLKPESLLENPLYIWGAAVMDGFFTEEEMEIAVAFIEKRYGKLGNHPEFATWCLQIISFINLYERFITNESQALERFIKLCFLAGLILL